jgi:Glycosyltransferase 61
MGKAPHLSLMPHATRPARDLLTAPETLLAAQKVALPDPRVFSNASQAGDAAFARWLHWCNAARHVAQPAVILGRYAPGALLDGSSPYSVLTQNMLVREQSFAPEAELPAIAAALAQHGDGAPEVDRPSLLACHRGSWTWGHWLLDTLPKIVLAERACPKLFTYVVPADILEDPSRSAFVQAVQDSLRAYRIDPARLLHVRAGQFYRFSALFDVADAAAYPVHHSLRQMHPGVLAAMREIPHPPPAHPAGSIVALLRGAASERGLANREHVAGMLREAGAVVLDPADLRFVDQVAAVRGAQTVAGDLGSNLACLIYAPAGTGLLSLAPAGWYDSFFVNVAQLTDVAQADVRGVSLPSPAANPAKDSWYVDPAQIVRGLEVLRSPAPQPETTALHVDEWPIARSTGAAILEIFFGTGGTATPFLADGFAQPEAELTWSRGPRCRIVVPKLRWPGGDLWLELEGGGFVAPPWLTATVLEVQANGQSLALLTIDGLVHLNLHLPATILVKSADLELVFLTPVCPSPKSMGVSGDARPLGFAFRRLALRRP